MDNLDKLDNDFAEKKTSAVKYWIWIILTFICDIIAVGCGVYAMFNNQYIALLTLVFGLFGVQAVWKAKAAHGEWNKFAKVLAIITFVILAYACVVLYILPMFD